MNRRWARIDYPSKTYLSESEAMDVLRRGPDPEWFEPAYQRLIVLADLTGARYGLVRAYGSAVEPSRYDFQTFYSEVDLRLALDVQWSDFNRDKPGDEPYDVFFFAPDKPLRLHLVIEKDDLEDDEADL